MQRVGSEGSGRRSTGLCAPGVVVVVAVVGSGYAQEGTAGFDRTTPQ